MLTWARMTVGRLFAYRSGASGESPGVGRRASLPLSPGRASIAVGRRASTAMAIRKKGTKPWRGSPAKWRDLLTARLHFAK